MPQINTTYGAIKEELNAMGVDYPGIKEVSQAVINIRKSKLPDPRILGNCGSFFKNPVVSQEIANTLLNKFPHMPFYALSQNQVKIPAGWLIEHAGWKGKKIERVGMHERQALVLVNYGGATGAELWQHAQRVQDSVYELFGIPLEAEVNII